MVAWLGSQGYIANLKRLRRLMHQMGLNVIYPKPRSTTRCPEQRVYPGLLPSSWTDAEHSLTQTIEHDVESLPESFRSRIPGLNGKECEAIDQSR